jgi:hypothetical protein
MKKLTVALAFGALLVACNDTQTGLVAPEDALLLNAAALTTITYTGQGFTFDGTTYILNDERCAVGDNANDGGTGQFADWNGEGEPYMTGQGYLVWVLSLNATPTGGVQLHLPDGPVDMFQVGGTWKYASEYYSYALLIGLPVTATFDNGGLRIRGTVNLVVSHGCQPFTTEGAWCSPGYWRNAQAAAWDLTEYEKTDLFNATVYPFWYGATFGADPDLITVLNNPATYSGSPLAGTSGYLLNAFNATGAMLTDAIPGYDFDFDMIGEEEACPIDNHGRFKVPQE